MTGRGYFFEYHEKLDIKEVTKNLCIFRENLWADSQWLTYGKIEETVADEGDVCRQSRTYQISAPINMSWIEGIETCRKLGSGKMTEIQDQDHLDYTVRRFINLKDQCEAIWTPLTDENVEGRFVSEITGELAGFLPWDTLEPDGFEQQNYIIIQVATKKYKDWSGSYHKACVACDLEIATKFHLTGLCEETHLDSVYFLNNHANALEYKGMHTTIRYQIVHTHRLFSNVSYF